MFVILSWMIPSAMLVKNIVFEKEIRLKEMMRIMGLGDTVHWIAWAGQSALMSIFCCIVISVMLKVSQQIQFWCVKTRCSLQWKNGQKNFFEANLSF